MLIKNLKNLLKQKSISNKMSNIKFGADRMTGFDKPTVWSIMTPLAVETKSINLVNPPKINFIKISFLNRVKDSQTGKPPNLSLKPLTNKLPQELINTLELSEQSHW